MTDLPIPRKHATDPTYLSGPAVGTPTKVDPGSALAASGIIPGAAYMAQHENYERNVLTRLARRTLTTALLQCRVVATGMADGTTNCGAAMNNLGEVIVATGGSGGVKVLSDGSPDRSSVSATLASVTSTVRRVVRGVNRWMAVGAGGNFNCTSTDNGATWGAGGSTGLISALTDCVWDGTQFVASTDSGGSVHSTTGASWAAPTGGADISDTLTGGHGNGLAVLTGGIVVAAGAITNPAFAKTTDHGVTWTTTGGTVPNPADFVAGRGYLAGDGGSEIYWLGNDAGANLKLFVSTNGSTWTLRSTITAGLNMAGNVTPRLMVCPDTGVMVAVVKQVFAATSHALMASYDKGLTWTDPIQKTTDSVHTFALAGGALFEYTGANLRASDGIGRAGL